jgi:hypothetical protein
MKTYLKLHLITTKSMLVALAVGLVLCVPGLANAEFNFTTIDVPRSTATNANGNSNNQIVGAYAARQESSSPQKR